MGGNLLGCGYGVNDPALTNAPTLHIKVTPAFDSQQIFGAKTGRISTSFTIRKAVFGFVLNYYLNY